MLCERFLLSALLLWLADVYMKRMLWNSLALAAPTDENSQEDKNNKNELKTKKNDLWLFKMEAFLCHLLFFYFCKRDFVVCVRVYVWVGASLICLGLNSVSDVCSRVSVTQVIMMLNNYLILDSSFPVNDGVLYLWPCYLNTKLFPSI